MWTSLVTVLILVTLCPESVLSWKCPHLYQNDHVSCICDMPHTVRCSGSILTFEAYPISVITQRLRHSLPGEEVSLLDLSIQGIQSLHNFDFENITLHGLVVSSGTLNNIPEDTFSRMSDSLVALGLPGNKLFKIPVHAINKLSRLERLDLSGNIISTIPSGVFSSLRYLNYLDLSKNRIRSFEAQAFFYLKSLRTLTLDDNQISISQLERTNFKGLIGLETLSLKNNAISGSLGPNFLAGVPSLRTLDLTDNNLTSLQSEFCQHLKGLKKLSVQRNLIDVIEDDSFIWLSRLLHLDLSNNRIVTVSVHSFSHLSNLRSLDISHNYLRVISKDILFSFHSLTQLNLQDNDISMIQDGALQSVPNLKKVNFADNPLHCDCRITDFLNWLVRDTKVLETDKETAVCATPPSLENGIIYQIQPRDISCDDDNYSKDYEEEVDLDEYKNINYNSPSLSDNIQSSSIHYNNGVIILVWTLVADILPYQCDHLLIYNRQELTDVFESAVPILCSSNNMKDPCNLELSVANSDLINGQEYRFCITLVQKSKINETVAFGCSEPSVYNIGQFEIMPLNTSSIVTNYNPQLPVLSAFYANVTLYKLSVFLRVSYNDANCRLNLKVYSNQKLIESRLVNCSLLNYTFESIKMYNNGDYQVCGSFLPNLTETMIFARNIEGQCVKVFMRQGVLSLGTLILTVFLSIMFFVVCLVFLLLIYCVTRKVLSPNKSQSLVLPSKLKSKYFSGIKNGIVDVDQDINNRA